MNEQPLVSVIIAAFNVERYIEATVRSVLNQTYQNFEIIIVDDCSTDRTSQIAHRLTATDARIRYIRLEKNSGRPAVPRNRGIAEARGELLAILDHDDLWTKWKLEDQVAAITSNPDLVLVYSMHRTFGDTATVWSGRFRVLPYPLEAALNRNALESGNTIPCSTVLTRLDLARQLGGFDEDPKLKAIEDYDFWLRISQHGPLGFVPRIHVFYRVHSGGTLQTVNIVQNASYLREKRSLVGDAGVSILNKPRSKFWLRLGAFKSRVNAIGVDLLEAATRRLGMPVPVRRSAPTRYSYGS